MPSAKRRREDAVVVNDAATILERRGAHGPVPRLREISKSLEDNEPVPRSSLSAKRKKGLVCWVACRRDCSHGYFVFARQKDAQECVKKSDVFHPPKWRKLLAHRAGLKPMKPGETRKVRIEVHDD